MEKIKINGSIFFFRAKINDLIQLCGRAFGKGGIRNMRMRGMRVQSPVSSFQVFRPQVRRLRQRHRPPGLRPEGAGEGVPPALLHLLRLLEAALDRRGPLPPARRRGQHLALQGRLPQEQRRHRR